MKQLLQQVQLPIGACYSTPVRAALLARCNAWVGSILLSLLILAFQHACMAATYYSRTTGNWNSASSWSLSASAPQDPAPAAPGAGDNVFLLSGHTITVNSHVLVGSFTINSGGTLVVGSSASTSGSLTYSANSSVISGGRLVVNAGGTLQDTYTGSYPGGSTVLTVNGGAEADPALQISGLVQISNFTIGGGSTNSYAQINTAGNVLIKNAFNMISSSSNDARLNLAGLLVVKGIFNTSSSGSNISTTGTGSFSAQGGVGTGNPANTVGGGVSYCQSATPCSIASIACGVVCNRIYTSPLPITLISFKATAENSANQVRLEWVTASEENNEYYVLERSKNALDFEEINRQKGAGNTSLTRTYTAIDKEPLPGINYYRLKQVDIDGKFTFSQSVAVKVEAAGFDLSPNPVNGKEFTILWKSPVSKAHVFIYTQLGRLVYSQEKTDNAAWEQQVHLPDMLTDGVYLLKIYTAGQTFTKKLVVQH